MFGAADKVLKRGDGQTLADARALVDALVLAGLERNFLYNFAQVVRNLTLIEESRCVQASCVVMVMPSSMELG